MVSFIRNYIRSIKLKNYLKIIWGLTIPSVSRIGLNIELLKIFKQLPPGIVLDIGSKSSPYLKYIPHLKYLRLDINKENNPDICCDIYMIEWEPEYFDTIIATEILEHLYDPFKAVNEIYRILKPGGHCICSTRFIHAYHPDPKDYYRFTSDSLSYLFNQFKKVEIYRHGNSLHLIWQILTTGKIGKILGPLRFFNPIIAKVYFKRTLYPLGFVVFAQK